MKQRLLRSLLVVLLPAAAVAVVAVWRGPERVRPVPIPAAPDSAVPAAGTARELGAKSPTWPSVRYTVTPAPESLEVALVPAAVNPNEALPAPVAAEPALLLAPGQPEPADRWPGRVVVAAAEPNADYWVADAWAAVSRLLSAAEGLSFFVPDHSAGLGVWMPTVPARAVGAGVRLRWSF